MPQAGPVPAGYAREAPFDAIQIDWQALSAMGGAELDGVSMGVTLVRRQPDGLYVRYLASGDGLDPHETWSSSKIFSMANGAGSIEMECGLGLDSSVRGEHGTTLLGDLATIICSYDETQVAPNLVLVLVLPIHFFGYGNLLSSVFPFLFFLLLLSPTFFLN